jgi:hypothetical protein
VAELILHHKPKTRVQTDRGYFIVYARIEPILRETDTNGMTMILYVTIMIMMMLINYWMSQPGTSEL